MSNDFLPPIPGEETNLLTEPNQDELKSLLADLPIEAEASASTDSPMELIASNGPSAMSLSSPPSSSKTM